MNVIAQYWQGVTMYRLMLYFLVVLLGAAALLSALGVLPYNASSILLQSFAFTAVCWGVNFVIARLRNIQPNVESSVITSLILSAIVGPLSLPEDWLPLVAMSVAAMASKYFIALRASHIFNPAAFGVTLSAIVLGYPASWWIGVDSLLPFILAGGALITWKIRRWHLIAAFLGTYVGLLALAALALEGRSLPQVAVLVQRLVASPLMLFFVFVMLVEPLTAPQTHGRRIVFGSFVGVVLFALQRWAGFIPYSLELSLLIGNAFTRVINPDFRQALVLRRKEMIDSIIGNFWLEPTRPFAFSPGQFLEYTFAHTRPDSRGVRRYYTIASSPTEKEVLLSTKFAEPGSTFKRALRNMQEGDEIVASKVAGDFVLPADRQQKLLFIAGGIGITPFRSMVKYLLDTGESRDIVLLYGVRTEKEFVFKNVFDEAGQKFGLRAAYVASDQHGQIDEQTIRTAVPDLTQRLVYISGPEPMVQSLTKLLSSMGVSRRQVKRDYFPGYTQ